MAHKKFSLKSKLSREKVLWIENQLKAGEKNIQIQEFIDNNRLVFTTPDVHKLTTQLLQENSKYSVEELTGFVELASRSLKSDRFKLNLLLEGQRDAYVTPVWLTEQLGICGIIFFQEGRKAPEVNMILLLQTGEKQEKEALYGYINKDLELIFENPEFSLDDRNTCSSVLGALIKSTVLCMLHDRLVRVGAKKSSAKKSETKKSAQRGRRPRAAHIVQMGEDRCRTKYAFYNALLAFDLGLLSEEQLMHILSSDHNTFNKGDDVDLPSMLDPRDNNNLSGWIEKEGGLVKLLRKFLESFSE